VQGILLWVIASLGDFIGNVMDDDDTVENDNGNKKKQKKSEVIKKHGLASFRFDAG